MNIVLFDGAEREAFLPLTFTKPIAELRMGVLTFAERWEKLLESKPSYLTQEYLSEKYPLYEKEYNLYINPCFFPSIALVKAIQEIKKGEIITKEGKVVAANLLQQDSNQLTVEGILGNEFPSSIIYIGKSTDLFTYNFQAIEFDFQLLTEGRKSQPISSTNGVFHPERIFIEEGAVVEYSILNAKEGPIYIGKNAEIMEGSLIRGSLALCEHAKINMGAKIYGGTTVGPYSKVGGEVNNAILMGYSNKGHEGFLGNSVLGEWCNIGADTNTSNMKNNYSLVKLWDYQKNKYLSTGLQFCGTIMGDYSKSAINTQFNTGTVVGVFANIFQPGFPPNKIDSFSWGGGKSDNKFELEKAYEAADKMMSRRSKELTAIDKKIIEYLYNI